MTALLTLGRTCTPDGQQIDVRALSHSDPVSLFSVHAAPAPRAEQSWELVWTATRRMQLQEHTAGSWCAAAVLPLVGPHVWDWAWRHALTEAREKMTELTARLRIAELEELTARAHIGALAPPISQAVVTLADGWTGTAHELLDTAILIDKRVEHD